MAIEIVHKVMLKKINTSDFYFLASSTHLTLYNSQILIEFSTFNSICNTEQKNQKYFFGDYLTCQKKKTLTKASNYSKLLFFYCKNYYSMLFYIFHVILYYTCL